MITRNWIHPDATFNTTQRKFTKEELGKVIDYWKRKLVNEYGAEPGQKIAMPIPPCDITYFALLFASLELGLKLVILPKPINKRELDDPRFCGFMPFDILVIEKQLLMTEGVKEFLIKNSKHNIQYSPLGYFNVLKDEDLANWTDKVFEEPVAMLCTTSGSTGQAKMVEHTHQYLHDLCSTNYKTLGFEEEDRVLHLNSFNHGSSPTIYYLPSLKACKHHITYPLYDLSLEKFVPNQWNRLITLMVKENITKVLSPTNIATDNILLTLEEKDVYMPGLTIMVLGFLNPSWLKHVESGRVKEIVSIFGCTEVGGPIFLNKIEKGMPYVNPRNLGYPVDNIFKTEVIDGLLTITLPCGKVIQTGDHLKVSNEGYTFDRKDKLKRINDIEINPLDIIEAVESHIEGYVFPRSLTAVVVDEIRQKLYLVTEDPKLPFLSDKAIEAVNKLYGGMVELDRILLIDRFGLRQSVVTIKPDHERLLDYVNDVLYNRETQYVWRKS